MAAEVLPSWVYLPLLLQSAESLEITGDEAHYLRRVVRARAGDCFGATDGRGTHAMLELLDMGPPVLARIVERSTLTRAATLELWCGAPEGERGDWLVEKLAELGVSELQPIDTDRGEWGRAEARRDRWDRLGVAALRQSRSAFRLEVRPVLRLAEVLGRAAGASGRWVCHAEATASDSGIGAPPGRAIVAVGPSSGFSAAELKLLSEAGFTATRLAEHRLRTETAALAAAAAWARADASRAQSRGT